jgi:DNA transformation protein
MAISEQLLEYILEQMRGLGRLTSRRMFSGAGLYSDGLFFGLLYKDRLYFKTDDSTRPQYEARGSEGFRPRPNTSRVSMRYYTVPADVLEDSQELVTWARQAVAVALASEQAKAAKKAAGGKIRQTKARAGKSRQVDSPRGVKVQGKAPRRKVATAAPRASVAPKAAPAAPTAAAATATKRRAKPSR